MTTILEFTENDFSVCEFPFNINSFHFEYNNELINSLSKSCL